MRFTLFLCAVVLLIAGCASTGTNVTGGTLPTVHHDRTTLQWGLVGVADVPTLDPALASDPTSITMASLVYGGLVRLDSRLRVQADGASRWTISRDGKTYTFFIRPGLRFADGRRVTAQDFASALRGALGPEGSAGTAPFYLQLIAGAGSPSLRGITVVDPSTLRITLIRPAAHFLSELAFPASFVPDPSLLQRYGATWTDHASGFGPFMVKTWQHSKYVTLVRNPYFY
ncbi:MAG TPA: ABC transporter substrate-binding protein, partial [Chloroflexota bacterium]